MLGLIRLAWLAAWVGVCAPSAAAHAQAGSATFDAGIAALDARDYATAEAHFRSALAEENQDRYRYNLALALSHQGKYTEVLTVLRPLLLNRAADPLFGEAARELDREARDQVGTIVVQGHLDGAVAVQIAGERRSLAESRLGILVDPGDQAVIALDEDGDALLTRTVTVEPGLMATVSIGAPTPQHVARAGTHGDTMLTGQPSDDDGPVFETWWFWTAAVAVVAAGVLSAVLIYDATRETPSPTEGNIPAIVVGGR